MRTNLLNAALLLFLIFQAGAIARENVRAPSLIVPAHYDGPVDPKIHEWMKTLRNKNGKWCCTEADGHVPSGWGLPGTRTQYWVALPSHTLHIDVPDGAVLHEANRLGVPMVWYRSEISPLSGPMPGVRWVIECFLPLSLVAIPASNAERNTG